MIRYFMLITGLSWATLAAATTFIPRTLPDQVKDTSTVIRGEIGTNTSDWVVGDDHSRRIFTIYQLEVKEVFKGDPAPSGMIHIRELGGEKDGVGMEISGAAQFAQGEDVVVFLGPENRDGSYDVLGLESGKFNIKSRADGEECLSGLSDMADGQCPWTLTSLRGIVSDQGATPKKSENSSSPVPSPSAAGAAMVHQAAPLLQTSVSSEHKPFGGQLWLVVLGIGLALLVAVSFKIK